jgi:hypothetical protein
MRLTSIVSPTERIHLVTREHGIVLLRPFFRSTLAVALFGGCALELAGSPAPSPLRWAVAIVAGVIVSISLLGLVRRVMRWNRRRLVVTDRRVLMLSGTFSRRATAVCWTPCMTSGAPLGYRPRAAHVTSAPAGIAAPRPAWIAPRSRVRVAAGPSSRDQASARCAGGQSIARWPGRTSRVR